MYDASGAKLAKTTYTGGSQGVKTDYTGGFVYENDELSFFAFSEGRVRLTNNDFRYEYDYKDHLGNVRLTFGNENGTAEVLQSDSYYPFGLKMPNLSYVRDSENKFTYNGKELEDEFNLNWYHYGVRFYDPAVSRWWSIDPAEEYQSPFTYVGNSPLNLIDPDGAMSENAGNDPCPSCSWWTSLTSVYNSIKNTFSGLWSGVEDYGVDSSPKLQEIAGPDHANRKMNLTEQAGYQAARFANDVAPNLYFEPYASVSFSRSDGSAALPYFTQLSITPRYAIGTVGLDQSISANIFNFPVAISAGTFVKYGSPINGNDLAGLSYGVSGGAIIGIEASTSAQPLNFGYNPYTTQQIGLTFSGGAWRGASVGNSWVYQYSNN